jgi:hypothetical protein
MKMEWIKINKTDLPPFKEKVLVTDEYHNNEENEFHVAVFLLEGIWENERGRFPEWKDLNNSGIRDPTHYCKIPELNEKPKEL